MIPDAEEKPKAVVVEDDEDFRAILAGWLSPRYEYRALPNGEELLAELEAMEPDILILDVNLPGPDGFRLCRRIRAQPRFRGLPILFLTALSSDADFVRHLEAGGTAYLVKPVDRRKLLSVLEELAAR